MAHDHALPGLLAAGADVVALHDRSAQALARVPVDAARCADLDDFLATPGLEAVYVATPNAAHRPLVEAAAVAGKAGSARSRSRPTCPTPSPDRVLLLAARRLDARRPAARQLAPRPGGHRPRRGAGPRAARPGPRRHPARRGRRGAARAAADAGAGLPRRRRGAAARPHLRRRAGRSARRLQHSGRAAAPPARGRGHARNGRRGRAARPDRRGRPHPPRLRAPGRAVRERLTVRGAVPRLLRGRRRRPHRLALRRRARPAPALPAAGGPEP